MDAQTFLDELAGIVNADKGSLTGESVLKDYRWDSMSALEYQAIADEHFGKELSADEISVCRTVADLADLIELPL